MRRSYTFFIVSLLFCGISFGGEDARIPDEPKPVLTLPRVESAPSLEDFLDMRPSSAFAGKLLLVSGGLIQRDPMDGHPASQHTDIYLGYDARNLYVIFVAFDNEPEKIRANMGRRETAVGDDIVEIQLDTFRDQRNAYTFLSNPHGVQWDAMWREGNQFDSSFDTVWHSRGRLTDRGYVVWMSIPFKSLRFPAVEEQEWGFLLVRDIPRNNESSFYPRMSKRVEGRLNQAGTITGIRDISPGRNINLIPYATMISYRELADAEDTYPVFDSEHGEFDGGLDAKVVFRDSMVVDLTVNPDFNQVESDEPQVTANQRFEVFFPEKRPFFLENAGYFESPLNLLFTRRITDPGAGIRLSGKAGSTNIGALVIDDEFADGAMDQDDPRNGESARFDILRLSRDLFDQSSAGLIYTGRTHGEGYNRVAGIDGRFKFNEYWVATMQAVTSTTRDQDGSTSSGPAYYFRLSRDGWKFFNRTIYEDISPGFRTDSGFIPRTDMRSFRQSARYMFRPEGQKLLAWGPELYAMWLEDHDGLLLSRTTRADFFFDFRRQTSCYFFYQRGLERLRPVDFEVLSGNIDFDVQEGGLEIESSPIKPLKLELEAGAGEWINFFPPEGYLPSPADSRNLELSAIFRPIDRLRIDGTIFRSTLDDRHGGGRIFTNTISRLRLSWQFNPRTSLRAIAEYDSLRTDPSLTSLETDKRFDADLLLSYQVNPWTALYVGYKTGYANLAMLGGDGEQPYLARTDSADLNDARQLFVKFSYLFRL